MRGIEVCSGVRKNVSTFSSLAPSRLFRFGIAVGGKSRCNRDWFIIEARAGRQRGDGEAGEGVQGLKVRDSSKLDVKIRLVNRRREGNNRSVCNSWRASEKSRNVGQERNEDGGQKRNRG